MRFPHILFIFFAIIFAVDATYIYIANKTWRGVVTQDGYQKGLNYNSTIDAMKKQQQLGWKMNVTYKNLGNKVGQLVIDLKDAQNSKIKNAVVVVKFKRPTQEGQDFLQSLSYQNSQYQAKINFPLIGLWDFEVQATSAAGTMQEVKRYIVQ